MMNTTTDFLFAIEKLQCYMYAKYILKKYHKNGYDHNLQANRTARLTDPCRRDAFFYASDAHLYTQHSRFPPSLRQASTPGPNESVAYLAGKHPQ